RRPTRRTAPARPARECARDWSSPPAPRIELRLAAVRWFRRDDETLNEKLLREAGLAERQKAVHIEAAPLDQPGSGEPRAQPLLTGLWLGLRNPGPAPRRRPLGSHRRGAVAR